MRSVLDKVHSFTFTTRWMCVWLQFIYSVLKRFYETSTSNEVSCFQCNWHCVVWIINKYKTLIWSLFYLPSLIRSHRCWNWGPQVRNENGQKICPKEAVKVSVPIFFIRVDFFILLIFWCCTAAYPSGCRLHILTSDKIWTSRSMKNEHGRLANSVNAIHFPGTNEVQKSSTPVCT